MIHLLQFSVKGAKLRQNQSNIRIRLSHSYHTCSRDDAPFHKKGIVPPCQTSNYLSNSAIQHYSQNMNLCNSLLPLILRHSRFKAIKYSAAKFNDIMQQAQRHKTRVFSDNSTQRLPQLLRRIVLRLNFCAYLLQHRKILLQQ